MKIVRFIVSIGLFAVLPYFAFAQSTAPSTETTAGAKPPESKPAEKKTAEVKPDVKTTETVKAPDVKAPETKAADAPAAVTAVRPRNGAQAGTKDATAIRLGDALIITVANDTTFRKNAPAKKEGEAAKRVVLFLNGQESNIFPIDSATENYVFRLERNNDNKELWTRLLEAPFMERIAPLHVSVGYQGGPPLPLAEGAGDKATLQLVKMDLTAPAALIWIGILILVLVSFFYLAGTTTLLRNGPPVGSVDQAYSLGRSQMAWWLFIVIISYVTIWMISGNRDTVSEKTLILLGISGATALSAVAIDATASSRTKNALDRLNGEITTLQLQRGNAANTADLNSAIDNRIAEIQQEEKNIITTPPSVSWIKDILTDDSGAMAIHRFQVVLWTFVLGVVFLVSVAHVLSMPEFSTTLLTLMGISSVTYLGFKFPTTG